MAYCYEMAWLNDRRWRKLNDRKWRGSMTEHGVVNDRRWCGSIIGDEVEEMHGVAYCYEMAWLNDRRWHKLNDRKWRGSMTEHEVVNDWRWCGLL